jgi:alkylhydroperoxidase family enzyme
LESHFTGVHSITSDTSIARIAHVDPADASGRTKELLDGVNASLGVVPNMVKTMAGSALLEGYLGLSGALARGRIRPPAAALAFAQAVMVTRGEVDDETLEAARRAGLDDAELAEIVGHVAVNVLTNYFNKTFAVELDFPPVHPGG